MDDLISRQAAIDAADRADYTGLAVEDVKKVTDEVVKELKQLPSAQPFHNITMNDVLKYIDDMPEDVWQEFTACLECRGWELQRGTAKWCGGEFA